MFFFHGVSLLIPYLTSDPPTFANRFFVKVPADDEAQQHLGQKQGAFLCQAAGCDPGTLGEVE